MPFKNLLAKGKKKVKDKVRQTLKSLMATPKGKGKKGKNRHKAKGYIQNKKNVRARLDEAGDISPKKKKKGE